jgi:hypothetical protein
LQFEFTVVGGDALVVVPVVDVTVVEDVTVVVVEDVVAVFGGVEILEVRPDFALSDRPPHPAATATSAARLQVRAARAIRDRPRSDEVEAGCDGAVTPSSVSPRRPAVIGQTEHPRLRREG